MPRPNDRFYDLLEVSPEATPRGLDHAYRRLVERLERRILRGDALESAAAEVARRIDEAIAR